MAGEELHVDFHFFFLCDDVSYPRYMVTCPRLLTSIESKDREGKGVQRKRKGKEMKEEFFFLSSSQADRWADKLGIAISRLELEDFYVELRYSFLLFFSLLS